METETSTLPVPQITEDMLVTRGAEEVLLWMGVGEKMVCGSNLCPTYDKLAMEHGLLRLCIVSAYSQKPCPDGSAYSKKRKQESEEVQ